MFLSIDDKLLVIPLQISIQLPQSPARPEGDLITVINPLVITKIEGLIDFQPFPETSIKIGQTSTLDKENPIKYDPLSDDPSNKLEDKKKPETTTKRHHNKK